MIMSSWDRGLITVLLYVVTLGSYYGDGGGGLGGVAGALGDRAEGLGPRLERAASPVGDGPHYTEEWVVHVPDGERHARSVAEQNGFRFVRKVRPFPLSFCLSVFINGTDNQDRFWNLG